MDLALYGRVLWRFKFVVALGLLLAISLATLSVATVSFAHGTPTLSYRKAPTYQSTSTILVTQRGFPWGDLGFSSSQAGRLASLPSFYAQLADSEAVQRRIGLSPKDAGAVVAKPVIDLTTGYGISLPLLSISARAPSGAGAIRLAQRATNAFVTYVKEQQAASRIPPTARVLLEVVNPAQTAEVVTPRKKTLPIMIFLLVAAAAVGSAFVFENLRPQIRVAPPVEVDQPAYPPLVAQAGDR